MVDRTEYSFSDLLNPDSGTLSAIHQAKQNVKGDSVDMTLSRLEPQDAFENLLVWRRSSYCGKCFALEYCE